MGLKICRLSNILPKSTIIKLWKCVEDISYITQYQSQESNELFTVELVLQIFKILQGDILEAVCKLKSKLPCGIFFNKISCQFFSSQNNGSIVLEAQNIKINPESNVFKLSGVASAQGKMKNTMICLSLNKLNLLVDLPCTQVTIEENTKSVSLIHKVPSLLVYNEIQLLAIEVSTRQYSIDRGFIIFPHGIRVLFI